MKITREAKIGAFAVVCLASLFLGIEFIKGRNIFSRSYEYYAVFSQVDGLERTNDVLINGYKVGLVDDIQFENYQTGKIVVTILVNKKFKLPTNTIAKMISADIMGGKAIKLDVKPGNKYHEPGDTLISQVETGLIDQLGHQMIPVKEKAERLMVEMERTLAVFSAVFNEKNRDELSIGIANLRKTLENVNSTTEKLDSMMMKDGSIRKLLANAESISNNIKNNNKQISNIIQNFSSISDSLAKANIASTLMQVDSSMSQLNGILTRINSGEGTAGKLLKDSTLYNNLEHASKNLELLLLDMKTNPKRYINFSLIDFSRTRYEEEKKPRN